METPTDTVDTWPYAHGNLRQALIEAALDMLETDGDALTLRAAAKAVDVSHTAPYNHFPNKEALLAAGGTRGFDDLKVVTENARRKAGNAPPDQLFAAGLAYILFGAERPALYRLMFGPPKAAASTDEVVSAGLAAFEVLVSVMQDAMASGEFRAGIEARLCAAHDIMMDGLRPH